MAKKPNLGITRRFPAGQTLSASVFHLFSSDSSAIFYPPGAEPTFFHFRFVYIDRHFNPGTPPYPYFFLCTMVALNPFLQICTILLATDRAHASHQTLVRRVVDDLQITAARKTHNLAKDLRVAFHSILPRAVSSSQPRHVVYCKPARQAPFSPGSSGGGTNTSVSLTRTRSTTRRPTSTQVGSSPTPTATSSWRLLESHVCLSEFRLLSLCN